MAALKTTASSHRRRWLIRLGALVLAGAVLLGVDAVPAFAHAQLLSTSPPAGAVLATAPAQVVLTFGEDVQAETNAIEVLTPAGRPLAVGPSRHPAGQGDQVAAALPRDLRGTYVVTWRVISADTHPVQGAFSFSVGTPTVSGATGGLEQRLLAARRGSGTVATLEGLNRFATLAAVIAFAGGIALVVWAWPEGAVDRRARRYLQAAAGAIALFALTGLVLQGVYGAGQPLGDLFAGRYLSPAFHSRFGYASVVRAGLAVATVGALGLGPLRRRRLAYAAVTAVAALAVVVTVSVSGHGATGRWQPVALLVDAVHVAAAATWIGGLALLAVAVLGPRRAALDLDRVAVAVRRYSSLAAAALAVVVASGIVQAWRQVGSWHLLSTTNYGHLLLLKLVAVAAVAQAGWLSRRWIHRHLEGDGDAGEPEAVLAATPTARWRGDPGDVAPAATNPPLAEPDPRAGSDPPAGGEPLTPVGLPSFRRWVGFEVALGTLVVVITSFLVNAAPPQTAAAAAAAAAPQPFTATIDDGPYQLAAAVTPGAVGANQVNLNLTDRDGVAHDPFQIYAQLDLPARHLGPIEVALRHVATGHWTATATIPLPGTWQLYIGLLTGPTEEIDKTLRFPVAG